MTISEFETHAMMVPDEVEKTRESMVITKRDKPIADVMPYCAKDTDSTPGKLSDAFVYEKDMISLLGEEI